MIYFDTPTKQRLIKRLYDSLKPGGYLIIGMSENLSNLQTDFQRVKPSVYRKI
jgi:chemotaxis protein methyltransferase CheR